MSQSKIVESDQEEPWKKELRKMWADEKKASQAHKETIKEAVNEAIKENAKVPDVEEAKNSKLVRNLLHATIGIVAGAVIITTVRSLLNKDKSGLLRG